MSWSPPAPSELGEPGLKEFESPSSAPLPGLSETCGLSPIFPPWCYIRLPTFQTDPGPIGLATSLEVFALQAEKEKNMDRLQLDLG